MAGILLIGGNGQVGREIAARVRYSSLPCLTLVRSQLDVTCRDAVLRTIEDAEPEVVVNASAYTAVDKAESEAELAFAVNRDGPAHLAEACARAGAPLVHISTDYVYDGTKETPYVESDPVAPLGVYGASKLAGEDAVRERYPRHLILRTSWVYGKHGQNFVKTMLRLGGEHETLRIVADQRGAPTFAGDLADAILALSTSLVAGAVSGRGWGTFHCAGQGATTWYGFARSIFEHAEPSSGHRIHVEAISSAEFPTAARRPTNSVLDCARIRDVHGIALRPWAEALPVVLNEMTSPAAGETGRWRAGANAAA